MHLGFKGLGFSVQGLGFRLPGVCTRARAGHEAGPLVILWTRRKGRGVGAGRGAAEAGLHDQVLERRGPGA